MLARQLLLTMTATVDNCSILHHKRESKKHNVCCNAAGKKAKNQSGETSAKGALQGEDTPELSTQVALCSRLM